MIAAVRRLRDCTSGSALLETTIVFPLLLTLMVGTIEFGRAVQDYHTADKAMRSAVRYLARVPVSATCDGEWGFVNAIELAVFGTINPDQDTPQLLPAWDESANPVTLVRNPACGVTPLDDETVVLRLGAIIPIQVQMLAAIGLPSTISIEISHEERHIGG